MITPTVLAMLCAIVSLMVTLAAIVVLGRFNRRYKSYEKTIGDLISPQRDYVENIVYNSSLPLTKDLGFLTETNHILFDASAGKDMIIRTKLPDFSFFEEMGLFLPEVNVNNKMAMCLMPFNRKFDKTRAIIAESCTEAGYEFHRSDDELLADNTDIRKAIIRMILEAQVVIAVLDGRNPNVFYEIGIAHSMGKLVLMVVNLSREDNNKRQEVDLLSNRLITYNNPSELKEKLVKTLKAIHSDERREEKANN